MKKLNQTIWALCTLSVVFSCMKETPESESISQSDGQQDEAREEMAYDGPVFEADLEEVKSHLDGNMKLDWDWGDAIGVTTSVDANVSCSLVNKTKRHFRADGISGSQPYWAVFPYASGNTFDKATNTLTATVPAVQQLTAATQRVAPDAIVAACKCTAENRRLAFKNCVSLLKLEIGRADIKQVEVTATDGTLAGSFTTVVTAETLAITPTDEPVAGSATVTLKAYDADNGGAFEAGTYYIAVRPCSGITKLQLTFTNTADETVIVSKTASANFRRNSGVNMGTFFSYSISTAEDLINWAKLSAKYTSWDVVELQNNITLTSDQANTLKEANNFLGVFNGNNHTLSGLTKPLFGNLYGSVNDLTVNANITSISGLSGTDYGIGILAHYLYKNEKYKDAQRADAGTAVFDNSISNVTTTGSLSVSNITKSHTFFVGGLAGSSNGVPLSDCINRASVTLNGLTFTTNSGLAARVGGVVGQLQSSPQTFTRCENYGAVTFTGEHTVADSCYVSVGGVFAHSAWGSTFNYCRNLGSVTSSFSVSNSGYVCVAGVLGSCNRNPTFSHCSNGDENDPDKGTVRAAINKTTHDESDATDFLDCGIGGVVGSLDYYNSGGTKTFYGAELTDCYNWGSVSDAINTGAYCAASSGSRHHLGGIVGRVFGKAPTDKSAPDLTLTVCNNYASVECSAPVVDTLAMGGIAGLVVNYPKFDACYNGGAVTVTDDVISDVAYCAIGGNLGFAQKGGWLNVCGNKGDISVNAVPGGTNAWINQLTVGGILAYAGQYSRLVQCTNTAEDLSLTPVARWNYLGGILGHTLHGAYVDRCSNSADLSTSGNVRGDYFRVGGVVGNFSCAADATDSAAPTEAPYGTLTGCINTGSVTISSAGTGTQFPYVGGVLGGSTNGATYLLSSRSTGSVSYTVSSGTLAVLQLGGLAGYMGNAGGMIDGCRTHATVSHTGTVTTLHIAEILGYCGTSGAFSITNNYVGGEVDGTTLTSSNWTAYRAHKAGGSFTYKGNYFWASWPND